MSFPFVESSVRNGRSAPPVPTDPSHEAAPESTGAAISWFVRDWGILALGAITVVPFLVISLFNHPAADDYMYAHGAVRRPIEAEGSTQGLQSSHSGVL